MKQTDRRSFLKLLAAGSVAAALPESIARAQSIDANNETKSIKDVKHIVILMQENRSFDHYFGTMSGVRGFSDPRAVKLLDGEPVFNQSTWVNDFLWFGHKQFTQPRHPVMEDLGLKFLGDLNHDWGTTHAAWNHGKYDQWIQQKGEDTMTYMEEADIPYHRALANAFTTCDAYHCSLMGPTTPNRLHMFTGWVGNDGNDGGPVIDNQWAGLSWKTYPEVLEAAKITWKVYQDVGNGINAGNEWGDTLVDEELSAFIGTFGDNSLPFFTQYQTAESSSSLHKNAMTGTKIKADSPLSLFDDLKAAVSKKSLPQVSWIVAPAAYSEHPNWPANYGAWYISQVLDILTSDSDLWSKTALFVTYDENDGFFDHMIPPTPPTSSADGYSTVDTKNELYKGTPYGLGVRVPMLVISPWSRGGYVNSQVFDHTSLIRFIEARFGTKDNNYLRCDNITPWRRAVTGDLTSAFDFTTPNCTFPTSNVDTSKIGLPITDKYKPKPSIGHLISDSPSSLTVGIPKQEPGQRFARPLSYNLDAYGCYDTESKKFSITFVNNGNPDSPATVFHVRSGDSNQVPRNYTIEPSKALGDSSPHTEYTDYWDVTLSGNSYDLSVYGPNGFFREFKGSITTMIEPRTANSNQNVDATVICQYSDDGGSLKFKILNQTTQSGSFIFTDIYTGKSTYQSMIVDQSTEFESDIFQTTNGWYDLLVTSDKDPAFSRHIAGHIENGKESITDPAIGGGPKVS